MLLDIVTDRLADAATVISVALHDGGVHLHRRERFRCLEVDCAQPSWLLSYHVSAQTRQSPLLIFTQWALSLLVPRDARAMTDMILMAHSYREGAHMVLTECTCAPSALSLGMNTRSRK